MPKVKCDRCGVWMNDDEFKEPSDDRPVSHRDPNVCITLLRETLRGALKVIEAQQKYVAHSMSVAHNSLWGTHGGKIEFCTVSTIGDKVVIVATDHDIQACKDGPVEEEFYVFVQPFADPAYLKEGVEVAKRAERWGRLRSNGVKHKTVGWPSREWPSPRSFRRGPNSKRQG